MSVKGHQCRVLHPNILCVAVEDNTGGWAACIGIVIGGKPEIRWRKIYASGNKLPQEVAEVLFPSFKHLKWRHDNS